MREKIIDYINEIALEKGIEADHNTNLFDNGILDSMEIILFLNFLEEELGLKIEYTDLNFENFYTIDSIMAWIEKRQQKEQGNM